MRLMQSIGAATVPQLTLQMSQVARALAVDRATLIKIRRDDPTFPRAFRIGKRDHVLFAELEAWVKARHATAEPPKSKAA